MTYEFAVKKEILNNGRELFTPVVRKKKRWVSENWSRITCIYGKYSLVGIDWEPELTYDECVEHIEGYKEALKQQIAHNIQTVEFHNLEETEL